ncbi:serine hydrolase [Spirosoma sp. KNUC1025]|uniref:serine hydrolase n=1 Tax=Spirosoma sp. KNUC1025 TaxID=2894082 RepID=UPI0038671E89|nr:serine hydrolase [Spirosoma sp. KNUC1025]
MKTLFRLSILLLSHLLTPASAQRVKTTAEKLDEYLTAAANLHRFNGTVLIAKKGTVLLQKGYGWRNESSRIPNDTASIYQLGSITKTFTGAAILQLQEEKKLSVKDKLSKYVPDYPNGDQITLENLFLHNSGIYDFKAILYGPDSARLTQPVTKEWMLAQFRDKPFTTKPGGDVHYTNSGYYLLGLVIEKVTGKPFETVIRERFITPLRLSKTGFDFRNLKNSGRTTGYTYWKDSVLVVTPVIDSTVAYAAGGMYSSTGDLYRWARAVLSRQLLKPESWAATFNPLNKGNWGYGWGINYFDKNKKLVFQNGNLPGFATFFALIPEDDVVMVMLANIDDTSDMTTLEPMLKDLFFITCGMPYQLPVSYKTVPVSEAVLAQYVGKYQLTPDRILAITLDKGRLFLQVTGQDRFEIFPSGETEFFLKVVSAQLTFQKDATGKVSQVVVHQNGDVVAKRL